MQVDIEIIGGYSPDVVWQSDSTAGWLADIAIYFVWELPWRPDATYAKRKPDILPPPTHSINGGEGMLLQVWPCTDELE